MGLYLGTQDLLEGVGSVDGTGTPNYLTKWNDADTIEDSIISDDGAIATVSGALVVTGTIDTPIISAVSLATDANGVIIEGTTGFGVSGTAGTIPVFESGGDGVGDSTITLNDVAVAGTTGTYSRSTDAGAVTTTFVNNPPYALTVTTANPIFGLLQPGATIMVGGEGPYDVGTVSSSTSIIITGVSGSVFPAGFTSFRPSASNAQNDFESGGDTWTYANPVSTVRETEVTGDLIVTGTIDTPIISAASLATNSDGEIIASTTGSGVSGTATFLPVFDATADGVGDSTIELTTIAPVTGQVFDPIEFGKNGETFAYINVATANTMEIGFEADTDLSFSVGESVEMVVPTLIPGINGSTVPLPARTYVGTITSIPFTDAGGFAQEIIFTFSGDALTEFGTPQDGVVNMQNVGNILRVGSFAGEILTTVNGKLIVTDTIDTTIISAPTIATNSDGVLIAGPEVVVTSGTAGTIPVFDSSNDGVGDSLVAQVNTSVPSTPGAITNTNTSILFTNSSGAGDLPAGRAGWITSSFSNYASGFDYSSTAAGFGASVVGFSIEFADAAAAIAFLGVASLANAGAFAAFATTVTVTQNDNATAQFAATHYARQAAVSGGVIIHFTQALNSTTTAITPISGSGTQANVSSTNTIGGATIPAVPGDAIVTITGDLTVTGTIDTPILSAVALATNAAGVIIAGTQRTDAQNDTQFAEAGQVLTDVPANAVFTDTQLTNTQVHTIGDARYATTGHTHTASQITDFNTAVDARISAIGDVVQYADPSAFTTAIAAGVTTWHIGDVAYIISTASAYLFSGTEGDTTGVTLAADFVRITSVATLASLGITASAAELNHTTGVTSGIQAQLGAKVDDGQVLTDVPANAVFTDTQVSFGTTTGTALEGDTALLQLGTTTGTALAGDTALLQLGGTNTTALAGDTSLLQLGTTNTTALAGNTALLQLGATNTTALAGDTTTISGTQATAIGNNTNKTSFPGFGTTAGTALVGNTSLLQLGTTNTTALAGNTSFLAGNTTTISSTQAQAIIDNSAKATNVSTNLGITGTTGARTITSSDGNDAIIPIATTAVSGVMSKAIFDEHVLNNGKTGITGQQATDIGNNNGKTTNQTHTGDVTGGTTLTIANNVVDYDKLGAEFTTVSAFTAATNFNVDWSTAAIFTSTSSIAMDLDFVNAEVGQVKTIIITDSGGTSSLTFDSSMTVSNLNGPYSASAGAVNYIQAVCTATDTFFLTISQS